MATRSTIGIRQADGTIKAIYCHWDGYPAGVGAGLSQNYNSKEQAEELIALGGFSSLMETLEETRGGVYMTAHYLPSDPARTFTDTTDWVQNFNAGEEYFYLWNPDTNQWTYSDGEKMFLGIKTESEVA
jgi:hypothetical protein